jgi:glycyl-tRNA synthetase beta chain
LPKGFADAKKLRAAKVIIDGEERAKVILDGARSLAKKEKLTLVEDDGLLQENVGLTEWPVPLIGAFDEAFLSVPPEVLATAMKAHQRCFSLRKGETLANRFVMVANLKAEDGGKAIVTGNERVIRARLADAKFFFDQDRKVQLPTSCPSSRRSPSTSARIAIQRCSACGSSRARLRCASGPIPILPSARRSSPIRQLPWWASSPSCKG